MCFDMSVASTMSCSSVSIVVADRSGHTKLDGYTHLPENWVADLPGDLAGVLDWPLLALPLGVGVALGFSGVPVMNSVSVAGVGQK